MWCVGSRASQVALGAKNSPANAGDTRDVGWAAIDSWVALEHGNPLQYSCLEKFHGYRNLVGYSL